MLSKQWSKKVAMVIVALVWTLRIAEPLFAAPGTSPLVAVVIPFNNFSIAQYQELQKAMQGKQVPFDIVSTQLGQATSGSDQVKVDHRLAKLNLDRYAAVILVGGPGAIDDFYDNPEVLELIRSAAGQGKIVGGS